MRRLGPLRGRTGTRKQTRRKRRTRRRRNEGRVKEHPPTGEHLVLRLALEPEAGLASQSAPSRRLRAAPPPRLRALRSGRRRKRRTRTRPNRPRTAALLGPEPRWTMGMVAETPAIPLMKAGFFARAPTPEEAPCSCNCRNTRFQTSARDADHGREGGR